MNKFVNYMKKFGKTIKDSVIGLGNNFKKESFKKHLNNGYLNTYFTLLISTFIIEIIFKIIEDNSLFNIATLRIFVGLNIFSAIFAYLLNFAGKTLKKILTSIIVFGVGFYATLQCGFLNFIGVYISFQTSSQLGAVKDYIGDFFLSFQWEYLCNFIPFIVLIVYYIIFGRKKSYNKARPLRALLVTLIITISGSLLYYASLSMKCFQNDLQTISNTDLFISASNPSLSVDNFGSLGFLITDVKALIWPVEIEEEYKEEEKKQEDIDPKYVREIDDSAWKMVNAEETNTSYQNLNNYFMNRNVDPKNDFTGMFENKNLIVIMMESTNGIFINKEYFPNFYKMVTEGWYWENNYSPRNSCATMNNEFSGMTGLYTISNTCTASRYRGNDYFESIFNLFNKKDYVTFSAHDYTAAYYPRKTIHTHMGSGEYYSVEKLGISYRSEYINWADDDDFMKKMLNIIDKKTKDNKHFMTWLTTVSAHQPYTMSSIQGDRYLSMTKGTGYPMDIRRYMSKLKIQDKGLGILLDGLEERGILDDTVIIMYGDHYPYGISKGHINKVVDYNAYDSMNAERVPFVIYNPGMTAQKSENYTSYINIVPTVANLFNLDYDPRLYLGEDLMSDDYESITIFADGSWKNEIAYYNAKKNKVTYFGDKTYTQQELSSITNKVNTKLSISNKAIKTNYFEDLGKKLKVKQEIVDASNENLCLNKDKVSYLIKK